MLNNPQNSVWLGFFLFQETCSPWLPPLRLAQAGGDPTRSTPGSKQTEPYICSLSASLRPSAGLTLRNYFYSCLPMRLLAEWKFFGCLLMFLPADGNITGWLLMLSTADWNISLDVCSSSLQQTETSLDVCPCSLQQMETFQDICSCSFMQMETFLDICSCSLQQTNLPGGLLRFLPAKNSSLV